MELDKVLYDTIGNGYNTTRRADPYITDRLFQLLSTQTGGMYLDIGCGTGNYTIALANKGINFYGVEPSVEMLDIARLKSMEVTWLLGPAEGIPVPDNFFDGSIATLTIHHWTELGIAFAEFYRVLKSGSPMIIFTADPQQMSGYWLNYYFPNMMARSVAQMPGLDMIAAAAIGAGFSVIDTEKYFIGDDLQDLFLYSGKNNPSLYLDEGVRKGISSFASLASREEVEQGILKLKDDIWEGRFETVKAKYSDAFGDYLFITLQKC
ncbi:class I SAM-dependent methyltransferase [Mucilaginibacter sp. FT3.2]|uniref:class I SAM-dependent methyltransferase n=1 Tax=Mucilaginibacter sp. FT3.2 TaxID=2723090 RepID=UPI0016114022|nr:class I SAM-dependent methyltransferase [Mucilaginibacter sp. FT3.2]MBB6229911.1 SAM-dependent methyltransferase [Mucilaginibacter sp. FT3.2]